MTTVCAFGYHDPEGARHWVIREGLSAHGIETAECRTEAKGLRAKVADLRRRFADIRCDALLVTFPGQYVTPLAWWLARRRKIPVILDAFISVYDTMVSDRRLVSPRHPKAWLLWFLDWLSCRLADVVLLDTEEHKAYFVKTFGVHPDKILVVPIGCRTDVFSPAAGHKKHDGFRVVFHGTFIPLQGIDAILDAAARLRGEPVTFSLIGKGQTWDAMTAKAEALTLENVEFAGMLKPAELVERLRAADAGLGIFGVTDKADRVIPHKAYEILAVGLPLLTGDTASARAVLKHGETALLSAPGDGEALAANIRLLMGNQALRARLAENGRTLSETAFSPVTVVSALVHFLGHGQEGLHHGRRGLPRKPSRG